LLERKTSVMILIFNTPISSAITARNTNNTAKLPPSTTNTVANSNNATKPRNTINTIESTTPVAIGTTQEQNIALEVFNRLGSVPNLKLAQLKTPSGGLPIETLDDAHQKLQKLIVRGSGGNLSAEEQALLDAFTNGWISQHPEDALKLKNPQEALTIARKAGEIFKAQIIKNYQNIVVTANSNLNPNRTLNNSGLPDAKEIQTFFTVNPSQVALKQAKTGLDTEISGIINPLSSVNPNNNRLGYASMGQ
jgi:hypothetical protein